MKMVLMGTSVGLYRNWFGYYSQDQPTLQEVSRSIMDELERDSSAWMFDLDEDPREASFATPEESVYNDSDYAWPCAHLSHDER